MAILTVNDITLSFGEETILEHITFEMQKGEHIGLVGVNGSGKTTLFKILNGEYIPDNGSVVFSKDTALGYMEQHVCRDFERTAFEEVMTVFAPLLAMERELEELTDRLSQTLPEEELHSLILRQTELNDRFVDRGGLTCRSRARSALMGLGFSDEQIGNKVGVLSGGQKAKLQLAKMLLGGANLLLLDEPTNHLDIGSCEALEDALAGYDGTLFVVSHDRYLINKLADKVYVLEKDGARLYPGNYDYYLERRETELAQEEEVVSPKVNLYKLRKERDAELRRRRSALSRIEAEIEENDASIKALEERLEDPEVAADYEAVTETSEAIAALHEKAEKLLLNWTELSEALEELERENSVE